MIRMHRSSSGVVILSQGISFSSPSWAHADFSTMDGRFWKGRVSDSAIISMRLNKYDKLYVHYVQKY